MHETENKSLWKEEMSYGDDTSSVECNKVVSTFLSFCGKSSFVLRFPLYFIVF